MKRLMFWGFAALALAGPAVDSVKDHALPWLMSQVSLPEGTSLYGAGALLALGALIATRKRINWKKIGFVTREYGGRALSPIAWMATLGLPLYLFNNITSQVNEGAWSQDTTQQGIAVVLGLIFIHTLRSKVADWLNSVEFDVKSAHHKQNPLIFAKEVKQKEIPPTMLQTTSQAATTRKPNSEIVQILNTLGKQDVISIAKDLDRGFVRTLVRGLAVKYHAACGGLEPHLEAADAAVRMHYPVKRGDTNYIDV